MKIYTIFPDVTEDALHSDLFIYNNVINTYITSAFK